MDSGRDREQLQFWGAIVVHVVCPFFLFSLWQATVSGAVRFMIRTIAGSVPSRSLHYFVHDFKNHNRLCLKLGHSFCSIPSSYVALDHAE